MLTYKDIISDDPQHPYAHFFNDDIIQRASCIEQQRDLAKRFQNLTVELENQRRVNMEEEEAKKKKKSKAK